MADRKNIPVVNLEGEIWVDILGFEGLYAISNKLRIKSHKRKGINGYAINEKILRAGKHSNGYAKFTFCKDGKFYYVNRHRVVAAAFIPNPLKLPCINHIDNDTSNDAIENLEWCTFRHNTRHAIRSGRLTWLGENNGGAKLKEWQVLEIFNTTTPSMEIATKFKVSQQTVNDIRSGRRWCEVTGKRHKAVSRISERI